jgi:hypothetical protein
MVYAYTQDVPITEDVYRKIIDRLGPEPLAGSLLHLCVRRPDGGLRYIDVWESQEACARAFEERIHPAVYGVFSEIGFKPDGEPPVTRLEVLDAAGAALPSTRV